MNELIKKEDLLRKQAGWLVKSFLQDRRFTDKNECLNIIKSYDCYDAIEDGLIFEYIQGRDVSEQRKCIIEAKCCTLEAICAYIRFRYIRAEIEIPEESEHSETIYIESIIDALNRQ